MPAELARDHVEAHLAILSLEGEYARAWDTADADAWAALFTDDGVFEMVPVGDLPGGTFQGHQDLADFCRRINQRFEGLHLIHVPSLRIEGSHARSWIHFEFRFLEGTQLGHVIGVYKVSYVRTQNGWRIRHRIERAVQRSSSGFYGMPRQLGGAE